MSSQIPDDRVVLEAEGLDLYDRVVQEGGMAFDDPRVAEGGTDGTAFAMLARVGLVREEDDRWVAVDPTAIQSQVVSPLSVEGARLLEESSRWARDFATLGQSWRRSPAIEERGPFDYLHGPQIAPHIAGLVADCESEILTAQPQTGRDTQGLSAAVRRDGAVLARGATVRTLYQHSARRSTATREYVTAMTKLGAEVRTLDEFFNRMIVIDRRVAIIPSPDDLSTALAVREPTVVAYLVDVFERSWERARPFTSTDVSVLKDIAAEQRSMTMRMLIEGHPDPASAKRLGVSPRTYAGYIADLKNEFEAETRFQLGYTIGKQGITGTES